MRRSQSTAEAQPLSTTNSTGPEPASVEPASSTGRASARITSVAAIMRSSSSHQGVRAGVSSRACSPISRRIAGNDSLRGAGGVTRSSHHSSGRAGSARSTQGAAKIIVR
jgi:hypothetical protein